MSELFKLVKEEFSQLDQEWQWTYHSLFSFNFNKKIITHITITDHPWKKKGREMITKKLILELLAEKVNGKILAPEPKTNPEWKRDHFMLQRIPWADKKYKIVFWFKDDTNDHLWIRNCHQQD